MLQTKMLQTKISFEQQQLEFLNNHRLYGFPDRSALVRAALAQMMKQRELKELEESADLYAQLFEEDPDMQELAQLATAEWPE